MFIFSLIITTLLLVLCFFPGPRAWISRLARALWVCRASAISVALGFVLFGYEAAARDLFAEIDAGYFYWTMFFVLVLAWALCAHYAARKALEQQAWAAGDNPLPLAPNIARPLQLQYAAMGTWLPRILGLVCFIAVGVGIAGAEKTSELMQDTTSGVVSWYFPELQAANVGTAIVYLLIVTFRRLYDKSLEVLLKGDPDAVISESSPAWFLKFLTSSRHREARAARMGGVKADWVAMFIVGVVTLCFVAATFFPLAFGYVVPRAWFVPVMLGIPLFPLAILTAFSHRLRFPLLLFLVLLLGWLALPSTYHNARTMPVTANGIGGRQTDLEVALTRWEQLNCPADGSGGSSCALHPVIAALAGGASRASFLSATALGDILDITRNDPTFRDFGTQMFAISGVSGGAVGAAMIRSALVDAGSDGKAPCKSTDPRWYGFGSAANRGGEEPSWKACLQDIAAGDFLSAAILGLAFRDAWGGLIGLWKGLGGDRAALLEEAFEARYARSLQPPQSFFSNVGALIGADRELAQRHGLARPLGYVGEGARWTPLLLLNTTSVDSGRRLIASELAPGYPYNKQDRRLFPEAYDLFEELPHADKGDIPLSTAATLSARFPLISPYGALGGDDPKQPSERLVDGGYFENDGVTTAFELVLAIKQLRPTWEPVVVHVTNDPVRRAGENVSDGDTPSLYRPSTPPLRDSGWFESLLDPLTALFGTRGGHAAQAVEEVLAAHGVKYARFQVFDEAPPETQGGCHLRDALPPSGGGKPPNEAASRRIDEVSLSWWLSSSVQEYLDRQLCHRSNKDAWTKLSGWLKKM
jgi:hypothetical protein